MHCKKKRNKYSGFRTTRPPVIPPKPCPMKKTKGSTRYLLASPYHVHFGSETINSLADGKSAATIKDKTERPGFVMYCKYETTA